MCAVALLVLVALLLTSPSLYRSKLTRELVDREADLLVRGLDSGDSLKGDLLLHNILLIGSKTDLLGNRVVLMPPPDN